MSDLLSAALSAANPYLVWIKLGLAAAVVLGLVGGGWWLHGKFDGTAIANAKTATVQCQAQGEKARADVNQAAATGLQMSVSLASQADTDTLKQLGALNLNAEKIMENVDAQPNGHALNSNPALGAYLGGLRNDPAAATAGNSN